MIQLNLGIPTKVRGYFTIEKSIKGLNLKEIESKMGYEKGRLKPGADIYKIDPLNYTSDFINMGTSVFQGHRLEEIQQEAENSTKNMMVNSLNTNQVKERLLKMFRRKTLIKVVPLLLHTDALESHLSREDFRSIKSINTHGMSKADFIHSIKIRFENSATLIQQIEKAFATNKKIYQKINESNINDKMYPQGSGSGVPQWKLTREHNARIICRLTNYEKDRY